MREDLSIKRRKSADVENSFDNLKREGVALAQQFSGDLWTDYNLHDPGVTILEQIIYGLTDLIHRADFPVGDYLNDKGRIDFEQKSLHMPEQIFSTRPITTIDYRKAILDAVPELDNLWITADDENESDDRICRGLYHIALKLDRGLSNCQIDKIIDDVRRFYNNNRNLCEDVADIRIVEGVDYELAATIEVTSSRRPVDILADIYFQCAKAVSNNISSRNIKEALKEDRGFDEVFDGPLTNHGLLNDKELTSLPSQFLISTLFTIVNAIDGVDHIDDIHLERDGKSYFDNVQSDSPNVAFNLNIPRHLADLKVVLSINGRIVPIVLTDMLAKFEELRFKHHSQKCARWDRTLLYDHPGGNARPLDQYYSIQNQFPISYGINLHGVPDSAAPSDKARAKQLQAYLLIFEQLMANYLANLDSIGTLFSLDNNQDHSYSFYELTNKHIAGVECLYNGEPRTFGRDTLKGFDDYADRRGRVLDYLLALYGESFAQNSLRHFNYYHSQNQAAAIINDNKLAFLKSIVGLTRDRASASDYSGTTRNPRGLSGVQQRVGVLLGFLNRSAYWLTTALLKNGFQLTGHKEYIRQRAQQFQIEHLAFDQIDDTDQRLNSVPMMTFGGDGKDLAHNILNTAAPQRTRLLSDLMLRRGVNIDNYRMCKTTDGDEYQLLFQYSDNQYWRLATYRDKHGCVRAANGLRRFLIRLSVESEGLHLIEHVLLRPICKSEHREIKLTASHDFYSFRASVIFPTWTARCHDQQFRILAEETVRLNVPSHICTEVYWFDFQQMYEFESIYEQWLSLRRTNPIDPEEVDRMSALLISFLIDNGTKSRRG